MDCMLIFLNVNKRKIMKETNIIEFSYDCFLEKFPVGHQLYTNPEDQGSGK